MLLDRRRIRKWAKWVALALAIIFALSFLFMGVGYGGAGFNISEIFKNGGCSSNTGTAGSNTIEEKLKAYEEALKANPNDTQAMLGIANIMRDLYEENGKIEYLLESAAQLEKVIAADPTQKDIYMRLARLYMSNEVNDAAKAVAVLNKAASADPTNPDVFLQLGIAQQRLNNVTAAVLAWQKYLELEPDGQMADTVRERIKALTETTTTTQPATTTTASGSSTTTTAGSTTSTADSTTTTAGSTTTATAPATTTTGQ